MESVVARFYYYGARYYNPRESIFLSVDPLAEKFFGRSPYEYTFSNPVNLIDPTGMGPDDPQEHTVGSGETLKDISKKYGVSTEDLIKLNNLKDENIKKGQILKVNPEMDFSRSPYAGSNYTNTNDAEGVKVLVPALTDLVTGWVLGITPENLVIGGGALKEIQEWSVVKGLITSGLKDLKNRGSNPGDVYSTHYYPGSLKEWLSDTFSRYFDGPGREVEFFTPVHIIGSFDFSMRVNADGKTVTIGLYDSKTIGSLSDNVLGRGANIKKKGAMMSNQYYRFIWTQKLK